AVRFQALTPLGLMALVIAGAGGQLLPADFSLDVAEPQILVEFPNDADACYWHHRVLLKRIAGPNWLCLTPDHDICRHNLETSNHLVLDRAAQFPAAQRAFVYAFDPIDRASLEGFKRIATTQAALLGDGGDVEVQAFVWVICDTSRSDYGNVVDSRLVNDPLTGVAFGAKGIIKVASEDVFVEKVQADNLAAWTAKSVADSGDTRLLGDHRDAAGKRKLDLPSAVAMMRESKIEDFPLQGVRACREYLAAVSEGPGNLNSYHSEWVRLSGVNEASAVCHTHRTLAETLRLLISFDQVDLSNLAGGEQLIRWIIQIETAVERNPKLPDFSGLDIVTGASTSAEGKALAPKFGEWITERMKSRATIWKSQRLYNEERRGSGWDKGGTKGKKGKDDDKQISMSPVAGPPALGVPARDRRHGDPFPLPVPPPHSAPFKAANIGQRQVFEAFQSLNALAGPTRKSACAQKHNSPSSASLKPTSVQQWMMTDVADRIARHGEQPADLSEESSLGELLATSGPYSGDVGHLASFDIKKIKVLSRQLRPQEAASLCPPRTAGYYKHFRHVIERDERELEVLRESNYEGLTPYWDPKLKRSRGARLELYQALHRVGLLTFRRRAKAMVGFFCVAKKDNMQRLIVDARVPNMCHRRPPPTRLGTSGAYLDLDLGEHAASGFGPIYEPSGNEGDVGDCFYNFLQESLASWFCTDDWMTSTEWLALGVKVGEVFDDDLGHAVLPGMDERLCPAFLGVCMGWSWALHMAQEIVSHQVSQTENFDKSDQIRDKQVAPLLQPGRPVLGIYVDNVAIIGGVPEDADRRMKAVCERFGQLGIPFEVTHGRAQAHLDTIGLRFDFARRALMHKSRRCWRLRLATLALLRRRKVRGSVLQVWGGHVIHHFSLLRPGMSCLHSFYRFIEAAGDNQKALWPSVRQEMRLVIGLLFLGEAHLGAPVHENVYLGDSSTYGFSLMVTKGTKQEVRQATLHRERWRFIAPDTELGAPSISPLDHCSFGGLSPPGGHEIAPPPGLDGHHFGDFRPRGSCPEAGVGPRTRYGQQLLQTAERRCKPVQSWRPSRAPRPVVEVPNSIPVVGPEWDSKERYTLLVAAPWQHTAEHINVKEMRVLLMGVRRCCRDRSALGHRVLLLSDNLVSVLALEKGRSSSYPLNLLCRRAAAYSIGGRISFRYRHIGTERNVADEPSRWFDPPGSKHSRLDSPSAGTLGFSRSEVPGGKPVVKERRGVSRKKAAPIKPAKSAADEQHGLLSLPLQPVSGAPVSSRSLTSRPIACQGGHKHEVLRGTERVRLPDSLTVTRNKTAGAGVYPVQLCRRWCQLATSFCPAGAFGDNKSGFEGEFKSALSHAAQSARSSVYDAFVQHGKAQNRADLDFSGNTCHRAQHHHEPIRRPYGGSSLGGQGGPTKRGRVLCAKDSTGVLLPKAKQLKCRKVTSNTLVRYHAALVEFDKWAKKNKRGGDTHNKLDNSMVEYMRQQYEDGHQSWEGSYLVFGYQLLRYTGLDSACLPESKKALKGWKTGAPGKMRLPFPEEVVLDVADFAVDSLQGEAALAIALQLDGYLRPSEVIYLTASQIMPPARKAGKAYAKAWGVVLAPSERAKPTKTGHFDDSVLIGDIQHEWLGPMLEIIVRGKRPEDRIFPSLTLASYERLFRDAMQKRFNNCIHATPHSVRHSGPSNDRFHKRRSLLQIQKRGRWASPKSVARYEKEALLLGIWRSIPEDKHTGIAERSRELPQ
ncbi:unnamed protein product, partial [Polarella glacialis]